MKTYTVEEVIEITDASILREAEILRTNLRKAKKISEQSICLK